MKYKFNHSIVIGGILLSVYFLVAEQFVLKRDHKRKKVSTNTLREQCATCMGQILELFTDIMHPNADAQQSMLHHLYGLFENDKKCFLLCASKEQLFEAKTQLEAYYTRVEKIRDEFQELASFLISLENNKKVPQLIKLR